MARVHALERADSLYRLLTMLRGEDFGGRPACADADPELFFPGPGEPAVAARAKAVCAACPILVSCRQFAVRSGVKGVWGGTSEAERVRTRRAAGQVA